MTRAAVFLVVAIVAATPAFAHHGGGTFDSRRAVTLSGKLTRIDCINPHSWIYFDMTGADGKVSSHRCETRSAHTLRRSGWTKEMFRIGQRITIEGSPDSKDPNSCYLNTIVLEDGTRMAIAATFEVFSPKDNPRRRCETTSIVFDWTFDGPVNRITQNRDTIVP